MLVKLWEIENISLVKLLEIENFSLVKLWEIANSSLVKLWEIANFPLFKTTMLYFQIEWLLLVHILNYWLSYSFLMMWGQKVGHHNFGNILALLLRGIMSHNHLLFKFLKYFYNIQINFVSRILQWMWWWILEAFYAPPVYLRRSDKLLTSMLSPNLTLCALVIVPYCETFIEQFYVRSPSQFNLLIPVDNIDIWRYLSQIATWIMCLCICKCINICW